MALVFPLAALARLFAGLAWSHFLEFPLRCDQPVVAELFAKGDDGLDPTLAMALAEPSRDFQPVRFRLPEAEVSAFLLCLEGVDARRPVTVRPPAVRCAADAFLGFSPPGRIIDLANITPDPEDARPIPAGDGGWQLAVSPKPGGPPRYVIDLGDRPLTPAFDAPAFCRGFGVAGAAYAGCLALLWTFRRRVARWLAGSGWADPLCRKPGHGGAVPRWERLAVAGMLLLAAIVQINAVLHGGVMGQDWRNNYSLSHRLVNDPAAALSYSNTNPAGYYLIASLLMRVGGDQWAEQLIGVCNLLVNTVALWLLHRIAFRLIDRPAWRVGAMTLAIFLPVRMIHSVVLAGDALSLAPMLVLTLMLMRLAEKPSLAAALTAGAALLAGVLIKFTAMSGLVAATLVLAQGYRRGTFSARRAVGLGLIVVAPSALLALAQISQHKEFHSMVLKNPRPLPGEMPVAALVRLQARDAAVFAAPSYDAPAHLPAEFRARHGDLRHELLIPGHYNYPALLHLGIFTDLMNIFQANPAHTLDRWAREPIEMDFGERTPGAQRLMAVAVKSAAPVTLAVATAIALLGVAFGGRGLLAPGRSRADVEAAWLVAVGWFANIVLFLPFVGSAYLLGFWLPRLILPSLMLFLLLTFYVLDRTIRGPAGPVVARWALAAAGLQSALHVAFLWSREALY